MKFDVVCEGGGELRLMPNLEGWEDGERVIIQCEGWTLSEVPTSSGFAGFWLYHCRICTKVGHSYCETIICDRCKAFLPKQLTLMWRVLENRK